MNNTIPLNKRLESLIQYLDGLQNRAPVDVLQHKLLALDVSVEDVADFVQFHETHYRRNLVCSGPWYHLLVLCWRSGQRSPIHNHAESTCGVRVLTGVATETKFESTPSRLVKAVSSHDLCAGETCASQDADIHQISNLQLEGTDLITLHIYSPPLLRMKTYSLTDRTISEYVPEIHEHCHGSGI